MLGGRGQGGIPAGEVSPLCQAWESENEHGVLHVAKNHKPLAEVLPWPLLECERKRDNGASPRQAGKSLPLWSPLSSVQTSGRQGVPVQSLWELTAQEGAGLASCRVVWG